MYTMCVCVRACVRVCVCVCVYTLKILIRFWNLAFRELTIYPLQSTSGCDPPPTTCTLIFSTVSALVPWNSISSFEPAAGGFRLSINNLFTCAHIMGDKSSLEILIHTYTTLFFQK